jgi:hypothetical protein
LFFFIFAFVRKPLLMLEAIQTARDMMYVAKIQSFTCIFPLSKRKKNDFNFMIYEIWNSVLDFMNAKEYLKIESEMKKFIDKVLGDMWYGNIPERWHWALLVPLQIRVPFELSFPYVCCHPLPSGTACYNNISLFFSLEPLWQFVNGMHTHLSKSQFFVGPVSIVLCPCILDGVGRQRGITFTGWKCSLLYLNLNSSHPHTSRSKKRYNCMYFLASRRFEKTQGDSKQQLLSRHVYIKMNVYFYFMRKRPEETRGDPKEDIIVCYFGIQL